MAITTLRQSAINKNTVAGTVTCAWPGRTTPGSLLIMAVAVAGGTGETLTTPTGWTSIGRSDNGTNVSVALYKIVNAAARLGTESITISPNQLGIMALAEYVTVALSSETDSTAGTNSGSSTSVNSGNSVTANANDLIVAALAAWNSNTATPPTFNVGPTNSFTSERTLGGTDATAKALNAELLDRIVTATGTFSTTDTIVNSSPWAGIIQAFRTATSFGNIGRGILPGRAGGVTGVRLLPRAIRLGAGVDTRFAFGRKTTADGNPAQPSLEWDRGGFFRFRWSVKSGTRTLSVDCRNVHGDSPYPTVTIKAATDIGVNADVVGTAIAGTGWQTIGPLSISPPSDGVVWVEIEAHHFCTVRWDNIVTT